MGPLLFLIMLADINKDISESNLISFADDTRIYSKINDVTDCDTLQQDLNHVYDWASINNMFFNAQKFYYDSFSPNKYFSLSNVYINPEYNIISPSSNVLDLGVYMSSNCTFDFHVASVYKRCSNLTGWILRTFNTRETITMMTLFKSLVLSRLDYASQLWSPHLLKSIYLIEKVQRSFTKHITGIKNKPYDERLKLLNLYSVQRRRDRYQIIYLWKIIEGLVPNLVVVVVYPLPWPLLVGGVRCSRLWSTSQLLRPSGQQCSHSGGVCPQIQGRQCGAYVGAVEEMMCVVCVDVTEGA